MYLSRLVLNPHSRRTQKEIVNPYEMHRTVMHGFPPVLSQDNRILFRLEVNPRNGIPSVLVQSLDMPDWSFLSEEGGKGYLLPMDEPNPAVKKFDPIFKKDQVLLFRLKANPTLKHDDKRVGLYKEEEQFAWLKRKAEAGGFHILSVQTDKKTLVTGKINRGEDRHDLKMFCVQFEGVLQVDNPEEMAQTIKKGIGSGKGLGFGLLSVMRSP
jgi:CRISPR system Cascade subunit CasE